MSGSHKEFPKKAVSIQLGLAALVGIGFLVADKPPALAMAEKEAKPIVVAAAKILEPVGKVEVKEEMIASAARSGKEVYDSTCGVCHNSGAAGAPKLDDKGAWETRLVGGFSALVTSAINGKGGMPARGGNPDTTDSEMELAVSHMIKAAGIELVAKSAATSEPQTEQPTKIEQIKTDVVETAAAVKDNVVETAVAVKEDVVETAVAVKEDVVETAVAVKEDVVETVVAVKEDSVETAAAVKEDVVETAVALKEDAVETAVAVKDEVVETVDSVKTDVAAAITAATTVDHSKGEAVYKNSCFACHDSGVAGSPKIGDKAAWTARLAMGSDSMYESAIKGKGAMPAKGGNMSISDEDVKAAVDYMAADSL